MDRRTLLKSVAFGAASLFVEKPSESRLLAHTISRPSACRLVVFGVDGLRMEATKQLIAEGSPGISKLQPPLCALSGGGASVTQPGWASIWSGLPSAYHGSYTNSVYGPMPFNNHLLGRLMQELADQDFFAVWITGKGHNIRGNIPESPHHQVYASIIMQGMPGIYHGDTERPNHEVYALASAALSEAVGHQNFCCFIHFRDPDFTGHNHYEYAAYLNAAREVDRLIGRLMTQLPPGTDVLYCSDHGFHFVELGEVEHGHDFAPRGILTANFPLARDKNVTRETIGRLIYTRAGGDPDHVAGAKNYALYGVDL